MLEQRQSLIDERRKASIATKLQKESIAKVMEEVRTNASKASKIISKAMTGQISLDSLVSTTGSRSKSASKTRKRSKDRGSSESPNIERSQSAGNPSMQTSGEVSIKYSNLSATAPQPYVSPYEMQ